MALTGRPSKLTDAAEKAIRGMVAAGMPIYRALLAVGIHPSTYRSWHKKAAAGKQPYKRFLAALKESQAVGEATLLKRILEASEGEKGQWTAAAWLLERKYPERYGRDRQVKVGKKGPVTVQVVYGDSSDSAEPSAE